MLTKPWVSMFIDCGAVKTRHLQSYLDEFQFRYNRRKTNGAARLTARAIEQLVAKPTRTMKQIIKQILY